MVEIVAKKVADALYVHKKQLSRLPQDQMNLIGRALDLIGDGNHPEYNVVKISKQAEQVSFLSYSDFSQVPFPELQASVAVNLGAARVTQRDYNGEDSPPILHRKELLLGQEHPSYEVFARLTRTLESLGLFGDTSRIGRKADWADMLDAAGVRLEGHTVVNRETVESTDMVGGGVKRHRTALIRSSLSVPLRTAVQAGLVDETTSVFDYGCGRGDDIALLTADGIDAVGWDPYFAKDAPKRTSDIVNLGYVLNVIENPAERVKTLRDAYQHAEKLLVVSALIEGQRERIGARRYRDGVITSRGTFQKFFSQAELRELIEAALETESVSMGPGLFFAFRDETERETFLLSRTRTRRFNVDGSYSRRRPIALDNEGDEELAQALWQRCLELGRLPQAREVPEFLSLWATRKFGGVRKGLAWLADYFGGDQLDSAAQQRRNTLIVYLALAHFRRKKLRGLLSAEIRQDLKRHFGSVADAAELARETLFQIADTEELVAQFDTAAKEGLAQRDSRDRFLVAREILDKLSAEIRVMAGIAEWLAGELTDVDLIRFDPENATVTFMKYRDFENEPFPLRAERTHVNLIKRTLKYRSESPDEPGQVLLGKSDFILGFAKGDPQCELDQLIAQVTPAAVAKRHVSPRGLLAVLGQTGRTWSAFDLREYLNSLLVGQVQSKELGETIQEHAVLPDLDAPCGRYFKYRDFIECGETQERVKVSNQPQQPESYGALRMLAENVLDPVIDEYGMIKLTYGFGSAELTREIPAKIAPRLDQHAACELNRAGNQICSRGGAAVDFIVEHESMLEVAQWIVQNTPFDRLYYYGNDRPIHVSYGPEEARYVALVKARKDGLEGPATIKLEEFLAF